jgi:hypothetical protein
MDRSSTEVAQQLASAWERLDWPAVADLYEAAGFLYDDYASGEHYENRTDLLDICLVEASKIPELSFKPRSVAAGDGTATVEWTLEGRDPWCEADVAEDYVRDPGRETLEPPKSRS